MIDEEYLKKIIKTINNKVEKIDFTDTNTIVDFADGEKMILHGGKNMVGKIKKIPKCSFCDEEKTDKNIMISPDNNENILGYQFNILNNNANSNDEFIIGVPDKNTNLQFLARIINSYKNIAT